MGMKSRKAKEPTADELAPQAHLSDEARAMWSRVVSEYDLDASAHLPVLRIALEAWDRLQQARREIAESGLTFTNAVTGMQHPAPALRIERDSMQAFRLAWKQLGLEAELPK